MPAPSFDAFLKSLPKGEILPAYYFHGDEDFLKDTAVAELLGAAVDRETRDFNLDRRRAADLSAEEFRALVLTPPMLAGRRGVVVTEIEALQQRRLKTQALLAAIVQYLKRPLPETLLILVQSSGTKVQPELATLARAVVFEPLPPDRTARWIRYRAAQEGLAVEDEAVRHLQAAVGSDLAQLSAELAKLKAAVGARAATAADVAELVGVRRGETAYDLVDAVASRRFPAAVEMVTHLVNSPGGSGVRLVSALGTALTGVALARGYLDEGAAPPRAADRVLQALQAARPVGLRVWREEAQRWVRCAAGWTRRELESALAKLLRADRRLKGTSLGDDADIVTDAILSLAAGEGAAV